MAPQQKRESLDSASRTSITRVLRRLPDSPWAQMTTFQAELRAQFAAARPAHFALDHTWDDGPDGLALSFPASSPNGFSVHLVATDADITVNAGRMHVPFDGSEPPSALVGQALALARDLLSPRMRLRERRFLGRPYRWYLEHKQGSAWVPEHEMGLLMWAPAMLATTTIYQNNQLPARSGRAV